MFRIITERSSMKNNDEYVYHRETYNHDPLLGKLVIQRPVFQEEIDAGLVLN